MKLKVYKKHPKKSFDEMQIYSQIGNKTYAHNYLSDFYFEKQCKINKKLF
jgi:hypothetical protein